MKGAHVLNIWDGTKRDSRSNEENVVAVGLRPSGHCGLVAIKWPKIEKTACRTGCKVESELFYALWKQTHLVKRIVFVAWKL